MKQLLTKLLVMHSNPTNSVENFALKIFLLADNEDRQGLATQKTAKMFLASSVFLEILKVFGNELDEDVSLLIDSTKVEICQIQSNRYHESYKEWKATNSRTAQSKSNGCG